MFKERVVVDCRGHMLGRLASVVAKELLNGQHVVAVRCEDINISGSLYRNQLKYHEFLRKTMNSNPCRGHKHFRGPAKIFWRTVRGMLPHKTARGQAALDRLKVFEGMPTPYDKQKKMVVPAALKVLRLKNGRKHCRLGDLSGKVGWNYDELVQKLEARRKTRAGAFFEKRKALTTLRHKAEAADVPPALDQAERDLLESTGFL
ncbi:unnamed protein product [Vitrella brassicaformis CCMP3155]|uniref:60S ribosomal protein L13a n=2 Tax=Vitrella brassicaformis TaxID=1169539 RepID=A0A0G4ECA4_VITBC|nr:unnamed protein product [Vitrella brassicaformis CCMP3155]|eukprot:CEL93133.1 unnamed protein product [Vitrella brassicaformis CCMP3155]